jgi:hypothetical protein
LTRFALPIALAACLLVSCSSTAETQPRPLGVQLDEAAAAFFNTVALTPATAQSSFAFFLPEGTINKRYLQNFRTLAEDALRKSSGVASMHYNASAERVFFLSEHKAPGWEDPGGGKWTGEVCAREFQQGTREGWTILHAFWSQYNRLLIGDDTWIQNLPESVRADLSQPLRYVVRVGVTMNSNPTLTLFIHQLTFELVEVGRERNMIAQTYPLVLSYSLL